MEINGQSGGSGELRLGGLPFANRTGALFWSTGTVTFYQVAQFNETVVRTTGGETYLKIFGRDTLTSSGTWLSKNLTDWPSSGVTAVGATITYFTD